MPGLLRRAKDLVEQHPYLRLVSRDEIESEDDGISDEERRRISAQIQSVVDRNRIAVSDSTFDVRPTKRGGLFIVAVNFVAIAIIAASVYGALWYFDTREQTITAPESVLSSAEGLLLETLREEAAAELSAKEAEIDSIQTRLAEISAERERLQNETESIIAGREEAIRAEFDAQLAAERARLSDAGLPEAEVDAEIARLREEQAASLENQIATVRAEAQAEIAEREAVIDRLAADFEAQLADAENERATLEEQFTERLAAETAELQAESAEIAAERSAALVELEQLRSQREQEQFTVARLTSLFADAQGAIVAGEFDRAETVTQEIREFLRDPTVAALPAIQRRREIDLFLADTLGELVDVRRREQDVDTVSLIETAALIEAAAGLIANADALLEEGDPAGAEQVYRAAIDRIPATAVGLDRLDELEARAAEEAGAELASLVASANEAYIAGEYETAADQYADVVAFLPIDDVDLYSRILDTGYQLRAEADRIRQLAALREAEAATAVAIEERDAALAALAERDGTVAALESRLTELDAERSATSDELSTQLEDARGRIADLESEVSELNTELEARVTELATARQQLEERSTVAGEQTDRVADLEAEIRSLESRLARAEDAATAAQTDARLAERRASNAESEEPRYASTVRDYVRFYSGGVASGESEDGVRRSAVELLETKLQLLRITNSQSVRAQYPDLYEETQVFFDDLVATERIDTEEETLAGLVAMLDAIIAEETPPTGEVIPDPSSADADALLGDVLERLQRLTAE
jgi:chromosome segregation ATPase